MLPKPLNSEAVLPWESTYVADPVEAGLPGLSVVIPIYNAGRFLEKTIRSLLCNDLQGVELIVMDGGSTDNTWEILAHYERYFSTVVSEKDRGQSDAINKGFSRATQPILYWLNGDDLVLPNVLVKVRRAFRDRPDTEVVVGNAYMTELDLRPIRYFKFCEEALRFSHLLNYAQNHLIQPSVFFTRTAWDHAGPVKEKLHYAMDADLFLGMAKRFAFAHLPVDIAYSVYHEGCKTRGQRGESISELALVQAQHGGFEEAASTLRLLVDLYNGAEQRAQQVLSEGERSDGCRKCGVLEQKLEALRLHVEKNKQALLEEDLEIIGG